MIYKNREDDYKELGPGLVMKTLVHGEKTLMTKYKLKGGAVHSMHNHPYEQTGYIVSGKVRMTIDGEVHELGPGDSYNVQSGMDHQGEIVEDTIGIEVFSPAREDYLAFKA